MKPGIIFWIFIAICIAFLLFIRIKQFILYKRFQSRMKLNDLCYFYVNADKIEGTIKGINLESNMVIVEDCDGDIHYVIRYDVHPYWF